MSRLRQQKRGVRAVASYACLMAVSFGLTACSDAPLPTGSDSSSIGPSPGQKLVADPPEYAVVHLGTLGGAFSDALGINDEGHVVGFSQTSSGLIHAFLWDGTTMRDLTPTVDNQAWATDINNSGHVVGFISMAGESNRAFLWDGEFHDLGTLGGSVSQATSINEAGEIAGSSTTVSGNLHAFLWDGEMHDLGTLGGSNSSANALNDVGQVVGQSRTAAGSANPFLWDGVMRDLGHLGGELSHANGINNLGEVAGYGRTATGDFHAFLWDGSLHDLGTAGGRHSWAEDIDDAGMIVGASALSTGLVRAARWDGSWHTLTPGEDQSYAKAVNQRGDIVGRRGTGTGNEHATLWRRLTTPSDGLNQCIQIVTELSSQSIFNQGQAHSLLTKLEGTLAALERGNEKAAANKLRAFLHELRALERSRRVAPEEGELLRDCAESVISTINTQ